MMRASIACAAAVVTACALPLVSEVREVRTRAVRSEVQAALEAGLQNVQAGRYREAEVIFDRALGPEHPAAITARANYERLRLRMSTGGMTLRTPRIVDTHPSR